MHEDVGCAGEARDPQGGGEQEDCVDQLQSHCEVN